MAITYLIRFPHLRLSSLRARLLEDLSREYWAVLLGKTERIGEVAVLKVHEIVHPGADEYLDHRGSFLRLKKAFIHRILLAVTSRPDLDTIIDVHTHPFSRGGVSFSHIDDADEIAFRRFLAERFENINYASIVFSQTEYSARVWDVIDPTPTASYAAIRTQTSPELIPASKAREFPHRHTAVGQGLLVSGGIFDRQVRALGLDVMRQIVGDQQIAIAGVGGLGSIVAEHLVARTG